MTQIKNDAKIIVLIHAVKALPKIISMGTVYRKENHKGRIYIGTKDKEVAIRLDYDGKARNWLVSGYTKKP